MTGPSIHRALARRRAPRRSLLPVERQRGKRVCPRWRETSGRSGEKKATRAAGTIGARRPISPGSHRGRHPAGPVAFGLVGPATPLPGLTGCPLVCFVPTDAFESRLKRAQKLLDF